MSHDAQVADVCLVVEGTYPFVRGGVSSWVHNLISGMPELTFSILLISAERTEQAPKYTLPENVLSLCEVFVHEAVLPGASKVRRWGRGRQRRAFWSSIEQMHRCPVSDPAYFKHFGAVLEGILSQQVISTSDALFSRETWQTVCKRYEALCPEDSFIDFFWTWRAVHAPILQLLHAEIPPARCYHLVSTGYAGLLGVLAKMHTGRPVLLTEHGIYVRERAIDIAQADWIYEEPVPLKAVSRSPGALKDLWTRFFVRLGEMTYAAADEVFTLFEGNAQLQRELGCPESKLSVVPNGVRVDVFDAVRHQPRPNDGILRVGFVGRVVPIKDVKTFVRACAVVARTLPEAEFYVCGPLDEDPVYAAECEALSESLGLRGRLKFTGNVDVREWFPCMDVFVLTSISEGQPLTVLEAACAGVPTVASDVGACRELIEGRTPEDRALGHSGIVTGVGDPEGTARAIVEILTDEGRRQAMIEAGVNRVRRYYRQSGVIDTYRRIYGQWCHVATLEPAKAG
ncbi:MAG: GT4 family glycosyltransferase PelF [Bradymonadia bacterium]